MQEAVYNSAIPDVTLNAVSRFLLSPRLLRVALLLSLLPLGLRMKASAADWNSPEQNLARKIVAVTGPGAVAVTFDNRSSLSQRDAEIVENGLRSALEAMGLHFVNENQAAANVKISLSENLTSYVWIAQIQQGTGDSAVVMISTLRPEGPLGARDSVPLSLRKILLWKQSNRILDIAVLEEGQTPTHIAVLDPENVSLYRLQSGKWQQEQALPIAHDHPWPKDLRGRLIPAQDHLLDVYLPGVFCSTASSLPLTLNCHGSDDPWPLIAGTLNGEKLSVFPSAGLANGASTVVPQMKAFFAPTRNFFTGVLTPTLGKFATVPKFYSAALLPRDRYTLWFLATTAGQVHMIDGMSDRAVNWGWGSDLASVKTACGAGWQVLAAGAGDQSGDSIRAYEFPDRDPVAVSEEVSFPGPITALWAEARADTAVAVVQDRETGIYEAFRLAMACDQ
jgi:hypothetical protein